MSGEFACRRFGTVSSYCLLVLALSISFLFASQAEAAEEEEGFIPLFNGKTLEGWEGNFDIWSAQDGKIIGKSKIGGLNENVFLCTTKRYEDFELRLDFLVVNGSGNTGVQFRSERVPDSTEVAGYQADIGTVFWGSLYDESRRNHILNCPDPEGVNALLREMKVEMLIEDPTPSPDLEAFKAALKEDGWNSYVIRAEGDRITLKINGYTTATYREKDRQYVKPGIIGLQIHSGGEVEVQFRDLRIKELTTKD